MRFVVEVVADDRDAAANLLREAAHKIKHSKEKHEREINHCIGDYRIFVGEDLFDAMTSEKIAIDVTKPLTEQTEACKAATRDELIAAVLGRADFLDRVLNGKNS